MPQFHVVVSSVANIRAEFDVSAVSLEEAREKALESARSGNALWRYYGLPEDALIEVEE